MNTLSRTEQIMAEMLSNQVGQPEAGDTIELLDRNTLKPFAFNVVYCKAYSEKQVAEYGWTHFVGGHRPKGRRSLAVHVKIVDGVIVNHSTPTTC